MKIRTIISAALVFLGTPVNAEIIAIQSVEIDVAVRLPDGEEKLERVEAENVKPGEEVIYNLRYTNEDDESAEAVTFIMPVPVEVSYVENSAAGDNATVTFSADGGQTFVARGRLTIVENDIKRLANESEITHIKWKLMSSVPAETSGEASFRAVVK